MHYPAINDGEHWGHETQVKLNGMLRGKLNCGDHDELTLTASSATTTYSNPLLTEESVVLLMPKTANAAAELATLYFDDPENGSVVINHANNAQADRTYRVAILM